MNLKYKWNLYAARKSLNRALVLIAIVFTINFCMLSISKSYTLTAASADINFETAEDTVTVGEEIIVSLIITSDSSIGDFEGYITYDPELMQYVTGPSCITGSDGYLKVSDIGADASDGRRKYSMTFDAIGYGVCVFGVTGTPSAYGFDDGSQMSVSSSTLTVLINAQESASSDSDLSQLQIDPGKLLPDFSPDVHEYKTNVSADTEKLIVSAVADDPDAIVKVNGNDKLTEGSNTVTVEVTAEDGSKGIYTITADKESRTAVTSTAPQSTSQSQENDDDRLPFEISMDGKNGEKVSINMEFHIPAVPNTELLPKDLTATVLYVDGHEITAYAQSEDSSIYYLIFEDSAENQYVFTYDRINLKTALYSGEGKESAFQTGNDSESLELNEIIAKTDEYSKNINILAGIIGFISVLLVICAVVCVRLYLKLKGYNDDQIG